MVSTNFSKPSQIATGFGVFDPDTDVLLLETGDDLLLQNGTDSLLLGGSGEANPLNFSTPSINATNFSTPS